MGNFIVSNEDFTSRLFFVKDDHNAEIEQQQNGEQEALTINDVLTVDSTLIIAVDKKEELIDPLLMENQDPTEEESIKILESLKVFREDGAQLTVVKDDSLEKLNAILEAKTFEQPRSLAQHGMSQHPSTSLMGVMIDEMLENTMKSPEAVVASRLSYIRKISDLVHEYDTLVNSVLALAESFSVVFPSRKINHDTHEIMEVNIPVMRTGHFTAKEIALITIYLRKKMENFPATAQELNNSISRLSDNIKFKDAQILSLKNRLEEFLKQKPTTVDIFVLKRQGRDRYLYLNKKEIKSSKVIIPDCIFTSQEAAETALIYAVKHQGKTNVKKIISYEILQMTQGSNVTSIKLQEAMKNAYK